VKQALEIRFLGLEPSPAVEAAARAKAAKLDQFRGDLMSCRVTIELAHKHQHQGRPYSVRIDVTVSDQELCVDRVQNEDVYVALRDAFDAMKQQIEQSAQRARGQEKLHAEQLHGQVVRVSNEDRCGFIRSAEGDEYWFGPDNVSGMPWEHLQVGAEVRFIPEWAAEGRQAKRVSVSRR
jgi:ribosome-associated translation inhibitor RaiA